MKVVECLKFTSVICAIFLAGCASTPTVGYESSAIRKQSRNVKISLASFEDGRTGAEKGVLGGMYNGYNMRGGNVVEPPGMLESLKKTLQSELHAAGYDIDEASNDLSIKAKLISLTCDIKISSEAAINLQVILSDKGEEIFSKMYSGKSAVFKIIGANPSAAINQSIKKITEQLIKDLNDYVSS
jgi:hypothetical protein